MMRGARNATSRSSKPPSTTLLIPGLGSQRCPALARSSASCCSLPSTASTGGPGCRPAPPLAAWCTAARQRVANAWGPQASKAAMRTAHGPCLQRPHCACVTPLTARSVCAVWRNSMPRGKPGASWRLHWAGRSLVGASARGLLLGIGSSRPQGAERVRPAPHWTPRGGAASEQARGPPRLRLCPPRRAEAPSPCARAIAWPPALALSYAAFARTSFVWAAPPPRPALTGASTTRSPAYGVGRYAGTASLLGRSAAPPRGSAIVTAVPTEPPYVCGAAPAVGTRRQQARQDPRPTDDGAGMHTAEKHATNPLTRAVCLLTRRGLIRVRRGMCEGLRWPWAPLTASKPPGGQRAWDLAATPQRVWGGWACE
jgi:hypothetical protein